MSTVTIEQAQAQLLQLIDEGHAGEAIVITRDQKPVATLTIHASAPRQPRTLKGTVVYMAPDFAAPLEEFKEYMP
ncbi:MAG: type II toxin-antitoxin system prevent-host-death family antitoxin [Planctomycetes bacterium]|nr:type II toxin-antitoxin system prevent-host-death family antitoxin [Planctomycetota bacterium]